MLIEIFSYLAVGLFAGIIAGLFGVGGGLIIVPVLVAVFQMQNMSPEHLIHLAVGTSLATIIFTSVTSIYTHHRHGAVLWPVFGKLTAGVMVGALFGAWVAHWLPAEYLRSIFGIFELTVAAQMFLQFKPAPHHHLPGWMGLSSAGGVIGTIASVVGVGGGSMTVPFLLWCQVSMQRAVATSAACALPIALAGTLGFVITGWGHSQLPAWSTGYVYWPACLGVVSVSMLSAPIGAVLAHRLPGKQLKRLFALFLAGLGVYMLTH